MANRIEQVIADIEEYIDGCKMQAFSNTKIIVDRPQIEQFLDELREYTPEEVKKYQRMLHNRDKIMNDARKKAEEVEDKAQAYAQHLVEENNITRLAYERANDILKDANDKAEAVKQSAAADAKVIRDGAVAYANDILSSLQSILTGSIEDISRNFTALINTLSENQKELNNMKNPQESQEKEAEAVLEDEQFVPDLTDFTVDFEDE